MSKNLNILVRVAMLIALEIILTRFCSIQTPVVRIGFGFLPVAICATLYGPVWAASAYAIGDVLGMLVAPTGPYFPGFTLSAAITGLAFGLLLHRAENGGWWRPLMAAAANCLLVSLLLNTYWLTIITDAMFWTLLPTRIVQAAVLFPVQFVMIMMTTKAAKLLKAHNFA
ncbi:folate ECF transporter [Clostridia bacterium]|nr:folate ECF transporter [Clostridia bacterium]